MSDGERGPHLRVSLFDFQVRPMLAFALGLGIASAVWAAFVLPAVERERFAVAELHKSYLGLESVAGRLGELGPTQHRPLPSSK